MPLAIDHDDTQVLDFDSPHSGGDDVFMGGETLPLDYGETQRVDGCDDQLGEGFQDWGKTQVIDEFEDTEVVWDGDEDGGGQSERTELVADEEGLVDDFIGEVGSGVRTKDADLVDPDASTDEDEGGGCGKPELSKKSFVALPVATLQSSGFTDACSMPEGNFNSHNHEKAEDIPTAIKIGCMETMPCSESALNIAGTKMNEIVMDSFRFIEGYSRDNYLNQEEEPELRSELKKGKISSQSPLRYSQAAAGLSYISSQEPGAQSQAIALGVVDKFLSVNDEGLSQDFNNEKTDKVISRPIASVKRAQCFVRKTDKSTGKVQVYDWIDSLEDEGGGELFSRRKNSFFDCKGTKEVSRKLIGAYKKSTTEGAKSRTCKELASSAKSKKKLSHELKKQTNTDAIEQLENSDVYINDGVYSCGPATQMAAEAIQALGNSSPIHFEPTNLQSRCGEVTSTSAKIKNTSRTCSRRNASTRKSSKSDGIMTRSKLQNNIPKSRTKSRNSSSKQSSKLRRNILLEDSSAEIAAKMIVKKADEKYGVISVNVGENAVSVVGDTMKNMVDKEVEKPPSPVVLCKRPPVGAKCIVGTSEIYLSPIAHRTRRSKAAELLNLNKTLSNDPCKDTRRNDLCAHRTVEMDDEFVSNASVVPKVNKIGCNICLTGTINSDYGFTGLPDAVEVKRVRVEEADASHDTNADSEFNRRKVKNIDKENQTSDIKMYNRSLAVVKPAIHKKKRKVFIRSFAEILDSVKRRKRSVSSSSKFEPDGIPSNSGKMRNESGVRTKPSLLFDILKPYFAKDSHLKAQLACKPSSDGTASTYSLSAMKQVVNGDNLEASKENGQCRLLAEDVNENKKSEISPVAISPSGLRDSPPVCKSQETSRLSFRKSLSRSPISRELSRLEASYTSPSKLNDVRRRKDMACFQVCFSNHLSRDVIKQGKKILKRLGIQDVASSLEATHFVADKFVRTRNMLEAMAMGKPVVTPMWLESCGQASSSIDEKNYILRDSRKEKEIGFSMPVSLARAHQHPLLQGKMVFITRNARPNQELISSLVKIAGGQPLKKIELFINEDDRLPDNLLILAGEEDFAVCAPFLERGAVVFSSELLLNGIVIQKLEYERHQLFLNRV